MPSWRPRSRQPRGSTRCPMATTRAMAETLLSRVTGRPQAGEDGSASDVRHLDLRQRGRLRRAQLRVAIGAARPDRAELLGELLVRGAEAERRAEAVPPCGKQTCLQPPLGREASS